MLSLTLFNFMLFDLGLKLPSYICLSIYVDNITVWVRSEDENNTAMGIQNALNGMWR